MRLKMIADIRNGRTTGYGVDSVRWASIRQIVEVLEPLGVPTARIQYIAILDHDRVIIKPVGEHKPTRRTVWGVYHNPHALIGWVVVCACDGWRFSRPFEEANVAMNALSTGDYGGFSTEEVEVRLSRYNLTGVQASHLPCAPELFRELVAGR